METNEPNVYPTILGGVSRGFWSPFEDLGARSANLYNFQMANWKLKPKYFAHIILLRILLKYYLLVLVSCGIHLSENVLKCKESQKILDLCLLQSRCESKFQQNLGEVSAPTKASW